MNTPRIYSDEQILATALAIRDEPLYQDHIINSGCDDEQVITRACYRAWYAWRTGPRTTPAPITARRPEILALISEAVASL